MDVVVLSRAGEAVPDLRREDFTVSEDGVRQEVVAFEAVHRPAPLAGAPGAAAGATPEPALRASTNRATPGQEPATFVIVFDELHLDSAEAERGRRAVAEFPRDGHGRRGPRRPRGHRGGHALDRADAGGPGGAPPGAGPAPGQAGGRHGARRHDRVRGDAHRPGARPDRHRPGDAALPHHRGDPPRRPDPEGRGARSGGFRGRTPAGPVFRLPGLRAGLRPQRAVARARRAVARGARRGPGTQVAGPRLGRPRPGPAPARVPPGRFRLAAREHGRLLPRRARTGGRPLGNAGRRRHAPRHRRPQHGHGSQRDARGERGQRGARARHGGPRRQEPQRPRGGPRPHRPRGAQLLPRRLRADRTGPRTGSSGGSR